MPSSQISYARKPCNVQALDQIMLTIDAELKEFHSDKYFFRIKQAIFERWSTKLNVDNRRLKYWFKGFQKNFSTKKCSGPKKSNYECFDSEIYARLPNFALNEKIDRIMIRWVAMSVIQIHDLSFKCSDSYLTRLILRLQIIAVKEKKCNETNSEQFQFPQEQSTQEETVDLLYSNSLEIYFLQEKENLILKNFSVESNNLSEITSTYSQTQFKEDHSFSSFINMSTDEDQQTRFSFFDFE